MSANVYVDHPAESGLLDTLVQAAVHKRAERRGFGSVPHLTEIKACWQATINLFWQEEDDRQVKDAIHEEQVVATSWHTQLQGVAQQFHAAGRKQQRWRAQIYEYWRVYLAFVRKRYEKLRDMITEGQIEQARRFVLYAIPSRIFLRLRSHFPTLPWPETLQERLQSEQPQSEQTAPVHPEHSEGDNQPDHRYPMDLSAILNHSLGPYHPISRRAAGACRAMTLRSF